MKFALQLLAILVLTSGSLFSAINVEPSKDQWATWKIGDITISVYRWCGIYDNRIIPERFCYSAWLQARFRDNPVGDPKIGLRLRNVGNYTTGTIDLEDILKTFGESEDPAISFEIFGTDKTIILRNFREETAKYLVYQEDLYKTKLVQSIVIRVIIAVLILILVPAIVYFALKKFK